MSVWQPNNVSADGRVLKSVGEMAGGFLSGLVFVLVEDDVNGPGWLITKLSQ